MSSQSTHLTTPSIHRRFTTWVIRKFFSDKMKRLIFVASIVGLIYEFKNPDSRIINKLNTALKLAAHPEAIELPLRVKSSIWKDRDLNILGQNGKVIHVCDVEKAEMTNKDIETLAEQLTGQAPQWLKYAQWETMCSDVVRLVQQVRLNRAPTPAFA